ncbi:Hsp20/alpha crystallin family protein [Ekhidna sp.]
MNLHRRKNHVFGRIGDRYSSFIDSDHFLGRNAFEESWMTRPVTNVREDESQYELEVGLPGYLKKDIQLSVDGHVLRIVAETKGAKKDDQRSRYIQKEIDTDRIERTFHLSSLIDADKITSNYENGLLRITLPFVDKSKSKAISVS